MRAQREVAKERPEECLVHLKGRAQGEVAKERSEER